MAFCYIGMGSNLGDRAEFLLRAAGLIDSWPECQLRAVAALFETSPVGGPVDQGAYFNSVAVIEALMSPVELLLRAQAIEHQLGRNRTIINGPRTLDLDLLAYDDRVYGDDRLILPHPRLHQRRFVLEPLNQVASGWVHPNLGLNVGQMLGQMSCLDYDEQACLEHPHRAWDMFRESLVRHAPAKEGALEL